MVLQKFIKLVSEDESYSGDYDTYIIDASNHSIDFF